MDKDHLDLALKEIENLRDRHLRAVKRCTETLRLAGSAVYVVHLRSLWADYGEKDVEEFGAVGDTLSEVQAKAEETFRCLNGRADVQAQSTCCVYFPTGLRIEIPRISG